MLSVRYKNLLRGFVDHELLSALREKDSAAADALSRKIFDFSKEELEEFEQRRRACRFNVDQARFDSLINRSWNDYNQLKAELLRRL